MVLDIKVLESADLTRQNLPGLKSNISLNNFCKGANNDSNR